MGFDPNDYLKEETPAFDPHEYAAEEPSMLDKAKGVVEDYVVDQLPALGAAAGGMAGGIVGTGAAGVGAVPGALAGAGLGGYLGKAGENLYNRVMRPERAPQTMSDVVTEPVKAGLESAGAEALGLGAGKLLEKAAAPVASRVGSYLRAKAAKLAEKATGATGAQVYNKFPEKAGEELLDRGIVRFGNTQGDVAKNAGKALDASREKIGGALKSLDQKGAGVTRDELLASLQEEVAALKGNAAKADARRHIEGIMEDVAAGPERHSLSEAEQIKRDFQDKVNWANPDKNPGNTVASDVYRRQVEKNATALDPDMAEQFTTGKKDYGTLAPIKEAAAKRAAIDGQKHSINLHSIGQSGLGTILGGEEGYRHGGLPGAIAGAAAGATLGPRVLSSSAVSANALSQLIKSSPEALGKFAPILAQAAARGPESLMTLDKLLQDSSPEYRQRLADIQTRETASR